MKFPRLILADGQTLLAGALHELIASDFEVVATVNDGHTLLDSANSINPDVIVVDIEIPLLDQPKAGRNLKRRFPASHSFS